MNVAMIGSGKLGFPVGLVMASRDHLVSFYDKDWTVLERYKRGELPEEIGIVPLWGSTLNKRVFETSLAGAIDSAQVIFVAVQTPHAPEQDGSRRFNHVRADFDLSYVKAACWEIVEASRGFRPEEPPKTVIIISTMLPGSMEREILPIFNGTLFKVLYSPSFIAMGTTVRDFSSPEFYLIGSPSSEYALPLMEFYGTINPMAPIHVMSYASAEATKVFYNTSITMKITLANMVMEMADKIPGCNASDVTAALKDARDRLASPAYMSPGMVDGGGCHPRDNIALSWLSDHLGLPYNLFDFMMDTREKQVEFLADLVQQNLEGREQVVIIGRSFKAGTRITAGSPSLLLQAILAERGIEAVFYDRNMLPPKTVPSVYVAAVADPGLYDLPMDPGSIVIDPWHLPVLRGLAVPVISPGRRCEFR